MWWFLLGLALDAFALGVFATPVTYRHPVLASAGWVAIIVGVWCYLAAVTVS